MGVEPIYSSSAGYRLNRSATPARDSMVVTDIKILLAQPVFCTIGQNACLLFES
jgi:hypothetical protein